MLPMNLTGPLKAPKVYVPEEQLGLFTAFNDAAYRLAKGDASLPSPMTFNGVKAQDIIPLGRGGYCVEVFELDHTVESRGYGIFEERKKLRQEYRGFAPAALKSVPGAEKYEVQAVKLVAYLTDTTTRAFSLNPTVLEYKNIVVECTYWDGTTQLAERGKHTHWIDLKPIVESNPLVNFILVHTSARYKKDFMDEVAKGLPANCRIFG